MPLPRQLRAILPAAAVAALAAAGLATWNPTRPDAPSPATRSPMLVAAWPETGRLSGPSPGLIADAAPGPGGEAVVLDVGASNVRVYDRDGTPRGVLGRRGWGPGEFAAPVALATDADGRMYVLDEAAQRVEVFRLPGGTRESGFRLPLTGRDLCTLGPRLFVLGEMGGRLIHEVSPADGRVLRSFAPDPQPDLMLSLDRAGGLLACGPGDVVVHLPSLRSEVAWYSASTGERLGTAAIPGYVPVQVRRHGGGVLFQAPPSGQHHAGASIVALNDGRHLIQTGFQIRGATRFEFDSIRTFILSPRSRTIREIGAGIPRLLAVRGERVFAAVDEPEPRVLVLRPTSLPSEVP
jgi:hypothetical protein